ncbi:MAG: PTS galactitol transporter subunit IIC [Treponema sp.]|jgi:PTS system galactitol-specific IIC component|nr:PTS galactitol transporter subunit IIC [Treponema sp.]
MQNVLDIVIKLFGYISAPGASVMMPIIIFILGIILGAPVGRALRAGLIVGVGFVGLNLATGIIGGSLGPAVQAMVAKYNLSMDAIDIGWVPASAIAFASNIGKLIIPVGILVNAIMLITGTTQTVNVDIWNYWHFAFTGAMVNSLASLAGISGGSAYAMGLAAAALNMVIVMVIADRTAAGLGKYNELPGISIPHGFTAAFVPIAAVVNLVLDKIPGINKIKVDMDVIQKRLGVFGEPVLIGVVFGLIIGGIAGIPFWSIPDGGFVLHGPRGDIAIGMSVVQMAVQMGAALVLIPKMAALLMEGLIPVSEAAQSFIEKHFKGKGTLYIGLDSAIGIGHPICLTCALILVPVSIFLAVILPGNRMLPFADLAVIPYIFVLIIPITKGDFFRSLIIGAVVMIVMFYCGSSLVELLMTTAARAEPATYAPGVFAGNFSSICDGSNPLTWAMINIVKFKWLGIIILLVISVGLAVWNRALIRKEARAES